MLTFSDASLFELVAMLWFVCSIPSVIIIICALIAGKE